MRDLVRAVKAGGLPATRHLDSPALVEIANQLFRNARISYPAIVLNRITDRAMEDYLRTELASDGITPVGTLREDPALSRAWLQGAALPVTAAAADAERIAAVLETIAAAPLSAA
jgi:CO dehydrogenase nickel-insertion accessory protein CooC1